MLILRDADAMRAVTMAEAVAAVEHAFAQVGAGDAQILPRQRGTVGGRTLHLLGGVMADPLVWAAKAYVSTPAGGDFWLLVFGADGTAVAAIESVGLSRVRTGAATGVATRHLSRDDSTVLAIIGSGKQAMTQVEGVLAVRDLAVVRVYSPTAAHASDFARRLQNRAGVRVEVAATAQQAVAGADVVVTMTNACTSVVRGDWLGDGMHLNLVGCNKPGCREADAAAIGAGDLVVVDDTEQAAAEAGDLLAAAAEGVDVWPGVVDLADIVAGQHPGRTSDEQVTIFDSLGVGIEDAAIGRLAYDRARELGLGVDV